VRSPFRASKVGLESNPRAIIFSIRIDVQHDLRDLTPETQRRNGLTTW
jgi:hypothetical protein